MAHSPSQQYSLFQDSIARRIIPRFRGSTLPGADLNETAESSIDEFVAYLASETWPILSSGLQSATYETRDAIPTADDISLDATSVDFTDTLIAYSIVNDADDAHKLLRQIIEEYIKEACAPPPVWAQTRTEECEICGRDIPLTYHHLIPRSVHNKALKKGWHPESMINAVAWLCRKSSNY